MYNSTMKQLLLIKDTRTDIEYNEVIGKKFRAKEAKRYTKKLTLYDIEGTLRKQKVRLRVKIITGKFAQVEVY